MSNGNKQAKLSKIGWIIITIIFLVFVILQLTVWWKATELFNRQSKYVTNNE